MDKKELQELGLQLTERMTEALNRGDKDGALALKGNLPKEWILMHKGLRQVIETMLPYIEQVFREKQGALAEEIVADIEGGRFRQAIDKLALKKEQHFAVHDIYIDLMTSLFSYMLETFGEKELLKLHRYTAEQLKQGFSNWENMSAEDFARASVFVYTSHNHKGKITVEEDEEKFTFTLDPCGSGGRLLREGAYGPPKSYPKMQKAGPMTLQRTDFPVYCSHCPVWNGIMAMEWYGHPQWVHNPPRKPSDPCMVYIYKNPENIPAQYSALLGKG